jgi:hypothetical protein
LRLPLRGLLDIVVPDRACVDQQKSIGPQPFSRRHKMVGVLGNSAQPDGAPPEFGRPIPSLPHCPPFGQCGLWAFPKEHRRIGQFGKGVWVAQQFPDRFVQPFAQQIPECNIDSGEHVSALQQIQAVGTDQVADAIDVVDVLKRLSEHGGGDRFAGTVRHRRDKAGDRRQRRRLTFSPPFLAPSLNAHQQRILAAVPDIKHLGHGNIEKIHRFDLHRLLR